MKKVAVLILSMIMILGLAGCDFKSSSADDFIEQDFLESVAKGLEARWELVEKDEDKEIIHADEFEKYLDAEYDEISSYEDEKFELEKIEKYGKEYIATIKEAKESLSHYNTDKWDVDYANIYKRSALALYMLNKEFPIMVSDEHKVDLDSMLYDGEVVYVANDFLSKVKFNLEDEDFGYKLYSTVMENTSDIDFGGFEFVINLYDANNVKVATEHAVVESWMPKEKVKFIFDTAADFDHMEVSSVSWTF